MSKKALLLAGLRAFSLCTWDAQAMNYEHVSIIKVEDNVPTGYEKIVLQGKLDYSAGFDDIIAGANESTVYLHFNRSFGNVDIKIFNATGNLVYNSVVDTSVQQTVIISIFGMTSGTHTVVLTNANGLAEGDFER